MSTANIASSVMALFWALSSLLIVFLWRLRTVGLRPKDYPPGPPTLPLIGNLHQMPKAQGHKQFEKWAREYGPVYSLILGTKVVVVLSTDRAVKELLDRRSAIYSSRPESYLGQQIFSGGLRVLFMPYGDMLRKMRVLGRRILNEAASRSYIPYQDVESKAMLVGFLESPDLLIDHIRRYTASMTTQMTFGFRFVDEEDPTVKKMFHIFERFSELVGSQTAALVDIYPLLRRLPDFMLPIRKEAKQLHKMEYDLFTGLYQDAKKKLREGKAKPSFCTDLARIQGEEGFSDGQAGYMTGSLLQAGSETSSAILVGFVQAMVIFPEVARTAQRELDRVCGDRLPCLDDMRELPYIRSCMKESMRWMPTALLGIPHCVMRDDEYAGYKIPKDAAVVINVWAIHNDPNRHPEPRTFDPSRWDNDHQTSAQAAVNADVTKRDHFVFGAGRRLCLGMHIADQTMLLAIARLLWAFDFGRVRDNTTGEEMVPDMDDLTDGMFVLPRPFKSNIVPRDEAKARTVRGEWQKAKKEMLDDDLQWKDVPDGLVWGK